MLGDLRASEVQELDSEELESLIDQAKDGLDDESSARGSVLKETKRSRWASGTSLVDSSVFASMSFEAAQPEDNERGPAKLNSHLSKLQAALYDAIQFEDSDKFIDMGGAEQVDLNFKIHIDEATSYYPLQLAASKNNVQIVEAILKNKKTEIGVCDEVTGANAFWLAAFFGHGEPMSLLAKAGINILCTHATSRSNALHIAVERKYP